MKYKKLILFSLCLTILFLSLGAISAASNTTDNQNINQNNTVTQQASTNITDAQQLDTKKEVTTNKSLKASSTLISTKTKAVYGNTYTSGTVINVKVTSNDNSTPNGNVKVYYNNKVYSTQLLENGKATFNVVGLPTGTGQVTVKYMGNNKYQASNMTSIKKITLTPTKTVATYGNTYTSGTVINVKVTSKDNTIPSGIVELSSNGKLYAAQLLSKGQTTFKITELPMGTQKISVKYIGSSKYQSSTMTSTKKITLIPTKTKATYGNTYTSGTVINVKVTSKDNSTPNGNVKIYYNNKVYSTQLLNNGKATFNIVGLPAGNRQIIVKYMGSNRYQASTMTSTKKITLTSTKTVATYGNTYTSGIVINVKVTSKDSTTPYGNVGVYSNSKLYATQLLNNGKTTFNIVGLPVGTQKIIVKYMGSSKYQTSNMTSTKKITLTSTKTVATYGNTYTSGTMINVKVTSKDDTTPYGTVGVYSDGKLYATQSLYNGKTTFNIKGLPSGTQKISVKYMGNSKYQSSTMTSTKKIILTPTKTTVTYGNTYTSGTVINVEVTSKDGTTPSGNVKLYSNDKLYATQSLNYGQTTFKIEGLSEGWQYINVKYMGNTKYQSTTTINEKFIEKTSTTITTRYLNRSSTSMILKVVVSSNDYTSPNGNVKMIYNNKVFSTQLLNNGQTTFNITKLSYNCKQVTVKYMGSSRYDSTYKILKVPQRVNMTVSAYTGEGCIHIRPYIYQENLSEDKILTTGIVSYYVNGKYVGKSGKIGEEGFLYNTSIDGHYIISVKYHDSSNTYADASDITGVYYDSIADNDASIYITPRTIVPNHPSPITISVNMLNNGESPEGYIELTLNGSYIGGGYLSNNGICSYSTVDINVTAPEGVYLLSATYYDIYGNKISTKKESIDVKKYGPPLYIEYFNSPYSSYYDFSVLLWQMIGDGSIDRVDDGYITITFNGQSRTIKIADVEEFDMFQFKNPSKPGNYTITVKYWGSKYYNSVEFNETKTITASDLNTKLPTQNYTLDISNNHNPRIKIYALDLMDRVNQLGYGKGTIRYTLNGVSKTVGYNPSATVKSTPVTFDYNGEDGIYTITAKYTSTNGKTLTTYYKADISGEEIYS